MSNEELFARAVRSLPGGNTRSTLFVPPHAPYAARAEGARVWDADGHEVIDCNNNYTSLIHGHGAPTVVDAAVRAVRGGSAVGLPTRAEVELAELLAGRVPGMERWRFVNSGTEAVMLALRVARAATGRDLVVRFAGSYHGTSDTVVDVSAPGVPALMTELVHTLPVGDLDAVRAAMAEFGPTVAAVLVDLMPNRAGLTPLDPEFVHALRAAASAAGALLIVDEIITFRLEPGGLARRYGLEPDLTTLGKIIGGGFPVGAVGGSASLLRVTDPREDGAVSWGGTFSANPVTMAAGRAALLDYGRPEVERLNARGDELRCRLGAAGLRTAGSGSLLRVFPDDPAGAWWRSYRAGVLLGTNGLLSLSTAMTDEDVRLVGDRIVAALA
ncbi:aspartate aminotransferase family protein [Pseudonocardia acaciae]|uniref:aspartate aminotransferase family protein n=1 Tax=Pseudonocardia acaciae TaxID=551276 RepID=UPI00056B2305|nr:aminotransferase class III-fold pyridoxal phosphate-dependent enzyme [Pseudonocardia acaciae]